MNNEPQEVEIKDSQFSLLLINRGNHAEIGILNRITRVGEFTTRNRPIPDEKDIPEITYDELFNHCPIDGFIVLELNEQGKDQIENFLGAQLAYWIEKKRKITKKSFIQDFMKYWKQSVQMSMKQQD